MRNGELLKCIPLLYIAKGNALEKIFQSGPIYAILECILTNIILGCPFFRNYWYSTTILMIARIKIISVAAEGNSTS